LLDHSLEVLSAIHSRR